MINYLKSELDGETVYVAEQNKKNFNAFITLLNREIDARGLRAYAILKDVFEDHGARLMWNTVVIGYISNSGDNSSYQALYHGEWDTVNTWENLNSIGEVLERVINGLEHLCEN